MHFRFTRSRRRLGSFFIPLGVCAMAAGALAEDPLPQVQRLQSSPVLRHLKPNSVSGEPRSDAERTVAQMYVPPGFRAELIAAEPDLHQPIAFAFDARGRLWVVEAHSYPSKRPEGEGLDKILIFEDRNGDGQFDSRKVFAEGLNLASGIEVGYGGVWVGAAPELLFIPDQNRDDVPDGPPQVLLGGFGYQDTHETLNSFLWGPDGWLYGIQGVFNFARIGKPEASAAERAELRAGVWRYHPIRREFEVFAHGGSNPWGLDYDEHGQMFMTHCRSFWGRGPTTHVIQGGRFWNQANANYAPFIIAHPPEEFPEFRNYLLASARYGHGAGGAGPRGSDAIYGGHSHVGAMIYYGDNWPDEFRGHLFTHNLGGHQINHQINERLGSGFNTVHAGRDQLFCSDPRYVAVDLQYGPDGAVYLIDWYDWQHCHNPNNERWDRGNGRIYRLQWDATYQPVQVDLPALDDGALVRLLAHKNEWFVRTARRLLNERSQRREIDKPAVSALEDIFTSHADPVMRLRSLWTLFAIGKCSEETLNQAWADPDEYMRAWAVQLAAEDRQVSSELQKEFVRLAKTDPSPATRLYLASAIQRVPEETAWSLAEALSQRTEDRTDRNLPFLLWHGLAPLISGGAHASGVSFEASRRELRDPTSLTSPRADGATPSAARETRALPNIDRALAIARDTPISQLADWIYWYAAMLNDDALDRVVVTLNEINGEPLRRRLAGLRLAMESRTGASRPPAWIQAAPKLYADSDPRVRRQAEWLAAVFGDDSMFPRLRETLADADADAASRRHAFNVLSRARDRASVDLFLKLLDDDDFRSRAIDLLSRFDAPKIADALLDRFESFSTADRSAALNALTGRASFALTLLDAVAAGKIKRDQLTAYDVRRLTGLNDPEINKRVEQTWGRIQQTPEEKEQRIAQLEKVFNEAPLWAYSANAGREHFQKLCVQCHRLDGEDNRLGPNLAGAGKNGVRYFLENVIDPDAVIGADYQMTTLETRNGEVLSGAIVNETSDTLTVRTTAGDSVLAKSQILERATSEKSVMPEGLFEALNDRERLELLKFLISN